MSRPAPTSSDSYALRVHGMDCADEVAILRREVGPLAGGEDRLAFDLVRGRMEVLAPPEEVPPAAVRQAVARTGMRAVPVGDGAPGEPAEGFLARHGRDLLTGLSGLFAAAGFLLHWIEAGSLAAAFGAGAPPWPARVLYFGSIAAGLRYVAPRAWLAARSLRPDMHLLMTVAIAGALGLGEWLEAATVAFLFALSQALEGWSVGRARRAVETLLDLSPTVARVREPGGEERTVRAEEVAVGARLVVRPGEAIPLDGEVLAGSSEVDQAPITGESVPVPKEPGDEVFAGSVNGAGALEVRSTRPAGETTLARIVRLVEQAQTRRSPSERWVDRFARVYTPAVMALAVAFLVVPPLVWGGSWSEWFYRALVLLVIACPCALVISTPVSVVAALAASARHGVLVKGGVFVEMPARLAALAFDKTGTLTRGEPRVVAVAPLDGHDEEGVLRLAAALEARSEHPLARAIVEYARERRVAVEPAEEVRALPGRGATGRVEGRQAWVGSHRLLLELDEEAAREGRDGPDGDGRPAGTGGGGPDAAPAGGGIGTAERVLPPTVAVRLATPALEARLAELSAAGRSAVVVGDEDGVRGLVAVADALRPGAAEVVAALRRQGIRRLVMLTGDNRPTAEAVAAEAGIDEVRAELLPQDKVAAVEELVAEVHRSAQGRASRVGMVGDGVNDAPAMARADLGVAMGAAGSDAAIETADVALMADDLSRLPWLVGHSRRTLAVIRQNAAFALGVKLAVFLLAAAGYATLWAAIAADMGASLLVIANALRLLRG
ncbi:MAG: heavy metal translocating P-type ATPase [Thermoanaerobaculia bacterium]